LMPCFPWLDICRFGKSSSTVALVFPFGLTQCRFGEGWVPVSIFSQSLTLTVELFMQTSFCRDMDIEISMVFT
jgi:hypothetical protein